MMSIKCENLKIVYPLSQKENSGWLERIRKYGDLGEIFPSTQMVVFFGTRKKVTGLSCTNHKMPLLKFAIFFLAGSLALVIHKNGSDIFVRFCKSGGKGIPNGMVHPGRMCAMPDICI